MVFVGIYIGSELTTVKQFAFFLCLWINEKLKLNSFELPLNEERSEQRLMITHVIYSIHMYKNSIYNILCGEYVSAAGASIAA